MALTPAGARRKSITRWVEVAGAAAVMVVGAGWLLLPSAGERVDFCNTYRPWERGEPLRYDARFRE